MADISLTVWPAIWSATAATLSAVTAFLTFRIHSTNSREAIRPELVIDGWRRGRVSESPDCERIELDSIKNVGRGAAFDIWTHCVMAYGTVVAARMMPVLLPILAVNDVREVSESIEVYWETVDSVPLMVVLCPIELSINYSDSRGHKYRTTYTLVVRRDGADTAVGAMRIAPGVTIANRQTQSAIPFMTTIKYGLQDLRSRLAIKFASPAFRDVE